MVVALSGAVGLEHAAAAAGGYPHACTLTPTSPSRRRNVLVRFNSIVDESSGDRVGHRAARVTWRFDGPRIDIATWESAAPASYSWRAARAVLSALPSPVSTSTISGTAADRAIWRAASAPDRYKHLESSVGGQARNERVVHAR